MDTVIPSVFGKGDGNMLKKICIITIIALFSFIFGACQILADDEYMTMEANLPSNQIHTNETFFDLSIQPEMSQVLEVTLVNNKDADVELEGEITNAWTTMNGEIDYSPTKYPLDVSLQNPLSTILELNEKEISLPAKTTKKITANLKIPKDIKKGIILGGIQYREKKNKNDIANKTQVDNISALIKGVKLNYDIAPEPNIIINKAGVTRYKRIPVITINVQNTEASIINNMILKTEVKKAGSSEILQSDESSKIAMAPNSNADLPIYWKKNNIDPGNYVVDVTVKIGDKDWKKQLSFTVDQKTSDDTTNVVNPPDYSIFLYIIFNIALVILVYFLIKNRRNKENRK
ncbi:hypothetical protein AZF37_00475 [endosymbiont 'TC1' of Trimyema compressum]|uniref:DUF916 domain-containing protein n=1 Tax=endosymbiont 'TC1' of Trimyema compressum TaxID=243899 RepID=UPI0007F0D24C|nr:DUF916 domain-containing protein [endosymbiont 'TC1' of Trimyema compressum]AMP19854.1 hypothetical protein AZF37_00475 [endosymbiont 'TC1' of Trimyema compressum]